LTGRILKIKPFHTRAMMLRACAYMNRRAYRPAKQLLVRLCVLLPENTVCESYFRRLNEKAYITERLSLGMDVIREEGVCRGAELISGLYADPKSIDEDRETLFRICRLCDWAFHSPMAGTATKTIALLLLSSLNSEEARNTLFDLLTDPFVGDDLKLHALQILNTKEGFYPYEVDLDGRLVRLAAGGISKTAIGPAQANAKFVQKVVDTLASDDTHASGILLDAFLAYASVYGHPSCRHESVCSAALEAWYLECQGRSVSENDIAARYGVSVRQMRMHVRRIKNSIQRQEHPQQEE